MTYTITLTDKEETSLKHLIAWDLEDKSLLNPDTSLRKSIYNKLLESEQQEAKL